MNRGKPVHPPSPLPSQPLALQQSLPSLGTTPAAPKTQFKKGVSSLSLHLSLAEPNRTTNYRSLGNVAHSFPASYNTGQTTEKKERDADKMANAQHTAEDIVPMS